MTLYTEMTKYTKLQIRKSLKACFIHYFNAGVPERSNGQDLRCRLFNRTIIDQDQYKRSCGLVPS